MARNNTEERDRQVPLVDQEQAQQRQPQGDTGGPEASPQMQTQDQPNTSAQDRQMLRHQSAPMPTVQDEARRMQEQQIPRQIPQHGAQGVIPEGMPLQRKIGQKEVQEATQILMKYQQGKKSLENRVRDNEKWYRMRHWESMRGQRAHEVQPTSGWLFNAIANKHADAMDNFPSPNILPREEADKGEAEMLTSIIPVILDQDNFEQTYSDVVDYKNKQGTGIYGIFWDAKKDNIGNIVIKKMDIQNLFWEPGIDNIQRSQNMFSVELVDNKILTARYPQLAHSLGTPTINVTQYDYDDTVDTSDKSAVVDWYYKSTNQNGKQILHYCKYVNETVLFATENEPQYAERGWYDHGMYPFVFDPLFRIEGTPCGFGYIDVGRNPQEYIDRGNRAILENMLANTRPRFFIRGDGVVNEEEFANMDNDFVHVNGNLGQDSIMPIQGKSLSDIYVSVINNKIDELKEVVGNRDISTGGTTSGVTAASAISAMQEAGSKLSRDSNKAAHRAFRNVVVMIIELIRQFYDLPRYFRILGENGTQKFVQFSNAGIAPQSQGGNEFGVDMGVRIPLFDVEVTSQKQSPYSKLSQNELALQFYGAGFFNPQLADQALACLDMMDFDRKDFVTQKIAQNGGLFQQMLMMQQQMLMLAQMVDQDRGTNLADQIAAGVNGMPAPALIEGAQPQKAEKNNALGGNENPGDESGINKRARQRVADSTSPT